MPRLDVIGVIVSDMERAIDFYARLGLQFPEDPDPEGHGHVETALPGGLRFTLDSEESVRSFDPDWSPPSGGHRIAIAFRCDSPDDVDPVYRELVDAGAESRNEPWDAFWGQRYAQAKHPDAPMCGASASHAVEHVAERGDGAMVAGRDPGGVTACRTWASGSTSSLRSKPGRRSRSRTRTC